MANIEKAGTYFVIPLKNGREIGMSLNRPPATEEDIKRIEDIKIIVEEMIAKGINVDDLLFTMGEKGISICPLR
jgi:hypothetical protein